MNPEIGFTPDHEVEVVPDAVSIALLLVRRHLQDGRPFDFGQVENLKSDVLGLLPAHVFIG